MYECNVSCSFIDRDLSSVSFMCSGHSSISPENTYEQVKGIFGSVHVKVIRNNEAPKTVDSYATLQDTLLALDANIYHYQRLLAHHRQIIAGEANKAEAEQRNTAYNEESARIFDISIGRLSVCKTIFTALITGRNQLGREVWMMDDQYNWIAR